MKKTRWGLVILTCLSLLGSAPALAGGHGKGAQGNGNQGQWVNQQPPGWTSQGQKKGWAKHGSTMPVGLQKNLDQKGKYPKGLQKQR